MTNVLILGGGFGGVMAAEQLVNELSSEHQITLVSRRHDSIFYPSLVRLAFGKYKPDDIKFDLRRTMSTVISTMVCFCLCRLLEKRVRCVMKK